MLFKEDKTASKEGTAYKKLYFDVDAMELMVYNFEKNCWTY